MKKLILVLALLALICPFMGMKLYLTNTSSSGQAQSDPNASLGGYRSTTELSATSMKNLFDDVSVVEALLGDTEYRMIDVYNDGTGTAYGVQLYMQTATSSSSTELDFGYSSTNQPHADAWNGEALSNESTAPASPSMSFSNYTKTSPLSLGTIPASQSKRVCVRRTVTAGAPWTAHDLGRFGVRWGVAASAATCEATPSIEATGITNGLEIYTNQPDQKITNASSVQICKVAIYLNNDGGTQDVTVQIRSATHGGGTQYGADKTVSLADHEAGAWYTFEWTSDFPNPTGDYYVYVIDANAGGRIRYDTGTISGSLYYVGIELSASDMAIRIYYME